MRDRLYHAAWLAGLAGLAVLAAFTLWLGVRALAYPYQLLHGEGLLLEFSRRLMAGEPVYKPIEQFPLGTCNYAPLPLLLARLLFPFLGVGFAAGRIWAFLATAAIAALLFVWVWRAGGRGLPADAAALAWLGAPYVYHWSPQFRVDLPGLALSLGGVYWVWDGLHRGRLDRWAIPGSAALFVLGLYCKQSFLAAPAAAVIYLFLHDRRRAFALAGSILLLGGLPFAILTATTRGAFWDSMVASNVNPFDLRLLTGQLIDLGSVYWPLMLLAAGYLVVRQRRDAGVEDARPETLIVIYAALALATGVLAGKVGSWENYFLEPLAALCLLGALGLARLARWPALRWAAPVLIAALVVLMWHTPARAARIMRDDGAANRVLGPKVAAAPGLVQSEDMGLLVLNGKPVPYYDFQLNQLALAGRRTQDWEIGQLESGAWTMVIFEDDARLDPQKYGRYTRAFVSALDYGYRLAERVGKYRVYRPAPLDRLRSVPLERGLALAGYMLPPAEVRPGDTLALDVLWQATAAPTATYTSFVHLVDVAGQGLAGDDREAWVGLYPTTRWAAGEMVRIGYTLTLPIELPAGLYTLRAGWYDAALNRLRPAAGGDSVALAVVRVPGGEAGNTGERTPLDAAFAAGIRLQSYRLDREPGVVRVRLDWITDSFVDPDYTVFVHLRDATGQTVSQGDGAPDGGRWPTSLWRPGEVVADLHAVPVPAGLPAGAYYLAVGLYDPVTGARVPLAAGGDTVTLPEIELP